MQKESDQEVSLFAVVVGIIEEIFRKTTNLGNLRHNPQTHPDNSIEIPQFHWRRPHWDRSDFPRHTHRYLVIVEEEEGKGGLLFGVVLIRRRKREKNPYHHKRIHFQHIHSRRCK